VKGSTTVTPDAEKSPPRSAVVGTWARRVSASMASMASTLAKKNDGQRPIGPPMVPPNWCLRSRGSGLSSGSRLLRASSFEVRKYS
jgi:hypothetical protein